MSGLPRGWVEDEASTICELVQSGGTPKEGFIDKPGVPFLKVYNIVDQKIDFEYRPQFIDVEFHRSSMAKSQAFPGDVLMNIVGPPLGKVAVIPDSFPTWNVNQALTIFRPSEALTSEWLYYFLCGGDSVKSVINETRGSAGQVNISLSQCRAFKLPLPPLAEQKRIVAKLDALSAKSARARTELARIETLVSRYKQAVLSKAFSGEFFSIRETGERREASRKRLSEICQSITDGDHQAPPKAPSGVPFITISAMNDGRIDLGKATRFVPEFYYEELQSSRKARTGDILYSVTGSYGIPAIVETDSPFVFQRHIAILRPDTSIASAKYLELLLASPEMRGQADGIATGTAQKTVPLKGLRNLEIPIPSLEDQHEIIRRIESAFAKIDRLAKEAKRALELVGRLDEAILAKAFRGELVPQDENDEPAEDLLARIRAERGAAPKGKRGRKASV